MIVLDYRDKRPLYEQAAEKLSHLIICGALAPDTRLPSVRALAIDLSVNPNTIQRAYAQLEQEGYLYTITGRGNFVARADEWRDGKLHALEQKLSGLITEARDAGMPEETLQALTARIYKETAGEKGGNL